MHGEYIERRDGGYCVAGTRISLDFVVYAFNRGDSPERILERYPPMDKLSRGYGAIAFYLDRQAAMDGHLEAAFHWRKPIPRSGIGCGAPAPRWVRVDLESAADSGLIGLADREILETAARQGRILITP